MNATARRPLAEPETLAGTIVGIRFHNPSNGWSVLSVTATGDMAGETVTAVGPLVNPREGDEYEFRGWWTNHAKFGRQFQFEQAEMKLPSTRKGIIRYLASIAHGVGEVKAAKIVAALGEDCLAKLRETPDLIDTVDFLTSTQKEEIKQHLKENRVVAELSALICREGITPSLAVKIVARYGEDAVRIVKENPYQIADEINGIGFLTADKIAKAIGIAPDSPYRVQAAVRHVFSEAQNDGHCYLRPNDFVREIPALLGTDIPIPAIAEAVKTLIEGGILTRDGDDIYLASMYIAEVTLAANMRALAEQRIPVPAEIDDLIEKAERARGITYHSKQREAIHMALTSGLSIITGGPGTGKTEITKAIVSIYEALNPDKPVLLCSPTGRAAKRLSEATGHEAKTIHRLLAYNPELGFLVNEANPLPPGLLIADEFSMADLSLADALFSACGEGMQVVLVGDVDQLPSVGPGSVLRDAIESGVVPVTWLEYIYRQEEGSEVSSLAHKVNRGVVPSLVNSKDVTAVEILNPEDAVPVAVEYAKQVFAEYGALGFSVLAPMHKGSSGVKTLNEAIRTALNSGAQGSFSVGDKVMVVKNDYRWEIFNGDLGIVRSIEANGIISVDFGDKTVDFAADNEEYADLDLLQLAWASTIHKAQGGEYPVCIVVLTRQHWIMLTRNLLYTAITRAKKHLVLIHQPGAIEQAVRNNKIAARNSRLAERLRGEK